MLKHILESIGMNPIEAKVYLACLKLGTQDVGPIAKEAGMVRSDTLVALSKLVERGFVSVFTRDRDFYTAEPPRVILEILQNDRTKVEESIHALKDALPTFDEFASPSCTKPELAFYEGRNGLIAAYEDTLTSKTEILAITSIDDIESHLPDYIPKYYLRRKTAGIPIKAIFPDTPMSRRRQERDSEELRESRLLPTALMNFRIEFNIYDDSVAYFSLSEQRAVIVKSPVIADSMRHLFRLCWSIAKPSSAQERKTGRRARRGRKVRVAAL